MPKMEVSALMYIGLKRDRVEAVTASMWLIP
jgi:hypothetical protein